MSDLFAFAGKTYRSRLLVGIGKYTDFAETRAAIDAFGTATGMGAVRAAFMAGRMPRKLYSAYPSSPVIGLIGKK